MTSLARTRPLGVTLVALIFLIEAILALGLAAYLLLGAGNGLGLGALFDRLRLPAALTSLLALPPLLTAGLAGLLFRGLWAQREWARLGGMVIAFLFLLAALAGLAFVFAFDAAVVSNLAALLVLLALTTAALTALWRTRTEMDDEDAVAPVLPPAPAPEPALPLPPAPAYVERLPDAAPPPPLRPQISAASAPGLVPPPPRRMPNPIAVPADNAATIASRPASPPPTSTQQLAAAARLTVRQGQQLGREIALPAHKPVVLGRDPFRVDALIDDPAVSGYHARIHHTPDGFLIEDLGSTNGTFVNDQPVRQPLLAGGDEVRLGATTFLFTLAS